MKPTIAVVAALAALMAAVPAYALYLVSDKGEWPTTWGKALELV